MKKETLKKYKQKFEELSFEPIEEFKKIICPSCNNPVPADNININDKIAKCNSCDVIFPFQNKIDNLVKPKRVKQEVIRPEGIDVFYYKDDLDITMDQPMSTFDIIFMTFSILLLMVGIGIYSEGNASFLLPLSFLGLSIVSLINLILRPKHKVYITLDNHHLDIKWRPKKFIKDKQFKVEEIDQIYTKKSDEGGMSVMMIVNGIKGQKHIKLISGLKSPSKARYLEQEIEHYLNIVDREIPEESA